MNVSGSRRLVGLAPANTSEATMLTAGDENPNIVGLIIANTTGSAAVATVKWGDGSTDYPILSAYSIAANTSYFQDLLLPLRSGYTIKVTSGTSNALTFTLVVVDFAGRLGSAHEAA